MTLSRPSLLALGQWLAIILPLLMLAGPAPVDIGALLITVLFLIHTAMNRDTAWLHVRWVQVAFALWAMMCLRNLFTDDIVINVARSVSFIRYPLFAAAMAFWILRDGAVGKRIWWMLAVSITFLIADTFWQYGFHNDLIGRPAEVTYNNVLRLTGPFSNPRVGITILWLLFPLLLPLLHKTGWRNRGVAFVLFGGSLAAIYLSSERTALLLWVLGVLLTFVFYAPVRRWLAMAIIVSALPVILLSRSDPTLLSRQFNETQAQLSAFGTSSYGQTWGAALAIAKEHPIVGIGSKQFQKECRDPKYGATDDESLRLRCPLHAHNIYLEWLVEYGAIGLGMFFLLIGAWLRDVCAAGAMRLWQPLLIGLVVTLLLRLWPLSVTPSQFVSWSGVPFWLVIGWIYALLASKKGAV